MSNVAGKAYAMNVLTPMRPRRTFLNRFIFIASRALPDQLAGLLGLSIIHFARWFIIKRDQWPDLGQGPERPGPARAGQRHPAHHQPDRPVQCRHVSAFERWVDATSAQLAGAWGLPSLDAARDTLLAKMAGRWRDGVPLIAAPDLASWQAFNSRFVEGSVERARALVEFRYADDVQGLRCPVTAHLRRMNTRDSLDPRASAAPAERMGSALNNRRRILRRGLSYGAADGADGEHGIVMLAHCSSLSRQFEFVQQQWLNFGLDFNAGNDSCPLVGNHPEGARFVIAASPASGHAPFIARGLPQFVSTRGGGYFFAPSMSALRMIGMGVVDPT